MILTPDNILGKKVFDIKEKNSVFSPISINNIISFIRLASTENTNRQLNNLFESPFEETSVLNDLINNLNRFNNQYIKIRNYMLVNKNIKIKDDYVEMIKNLIKN